MSHIHKIMKDIGKTLGIFIAKSQHFGRKYGQQKGELLDMTQEDLDDVGNWSRKARKKHYSLKIPFRALRVLAGFSDKLGSCRWDRALVDMTGLNIDGVPLEQCIFPFVEKMEQDIKELHDKGIYKTTANGFVRVLKMLRPIILQDAACLILLGRKHLIFEHHVFKSDAFKTLLERMRKIQDADKPEHQIDIQTAITHEVKEEMNSFHRTLHNRMGQVQHTIQESNQKTTSNLTNLVSSINQIPKKRDLETAFRNLANSFSSPEKKQCCDRQEQNKQHNKDVIPLPIHMQDQNVTYPSIEATNMENETNYENCKITENVEEDMGVRDASKAPYDYGH